MDIMREKIKDIAAVNDKAFDLIAEVAAQEEIEAALAAMAASDAAGVFPEETASLNRLDAYYGKQVYKHFRRLKAKRLFTRTLPRIGQVAAIVIAVIAVAGTVAIATSHTVRVGVMELFYTVEKEYTSVTMQENEAASFEVPAQWQEEYYPAFVPSGLHITQLYSDGQNGFIDWCDSQENACLYFSVKSENTITNVDTEDAEVEHFEIGNIKEGILITKNGMQTVVWRMFDRYFVLNATHLDKETTMKIVESVQIIK